MDLCINNYNVEIDGEELCVDVIVSVSIGNDGIGSYEYWGYCGFDKGTNYVEEFTIDDILLNNKSIEDKDLYTKIEEFLMESETFSKSVDASLEDYWL